MRRNQHTTNLKRQMQGAPPHMSWASSGAHKEWQKAVADGNMEQAQALWNEHVIRAPQVVRGQRKTYSRSGRQQAPLLSMAQQIARAGREIPTLATATSPGSAALSGRRLSGQSLIYGRRHGVKGDTDARDRRSTSGTGQGRRQFLDP